MHKFLYRIITFVFVSLVASNVAIAGGTINVCSDKNLWYPFTFVEEGEAVGLQIDIISKALSNLGYDVNYKPLPWKRCLSSAESGEFDAVATASYKDKRAAFLNYPSDASSVKKSAHRVMQVEYVVVTAASNSYQYAGDIATIPTPVRVPRGYSIGDDLKKQGLKVDDTAAGDENNIKKMLRKGDGSVVTLPKIVELLSKQDAYKGKLNVSATPVKSKSYYFPFSKASKISKADQEKIWLEIANVRNDLAFMGKMSAKY
jgi:polar amino acid transport system substrate-binding protein